MKKIKNLIRQKTDLYFFIQRFYLPIKKLKNRKKYQKQYDIVINKLSKLPNKKILYVGVPVHSNLGDQAQYYCIKKWLQKNYSDFEIIEIPDSIIYTNYKRIVNKLKKYIDKKDIFVFQSGYRTTDVANYEGNYAHQKILSNFKNRVIVFPQTVNFKSNNEMKKCGNAYKKNSNYLFLARDEISYKIICKILDSKRVLLYPDIVTTLIGNCSLIDNNNEKKGILLCLRNDSEKLNTDEEYRKIINKLNEITNKIDITDTNSDKNFEYDRSICSEELKRKLEQFSKYKLVITDRYHGTIFSLVSNTPVIVLNSTDHKLSSGVNWFKNNYNDYVTYCNDLDNVYGLAKNIYDKNNVQIKKAYFKNNYYDKLYEKINSTIH